MSSWRNSKESFGRVAIILHWLVALMVFALLAVGFIVDDMANTPQKFRLLDMHKSFGLTLLALVVLRILWWAANPVPAFPPGRPRWEHVLARAVEGGLYLLLLAQPISGWIMTDASPFNRPLQWFGLVTLPDMLAPDKELGGMAHQAHSLFAFALLGLIGLHLAGALRHHFMLKDNVLIRMLPWLKRSGAGDGA